MQKLILLIEEVEEISEDLKASCELFKNSEGIIGALGNIFVYLSEGKQEYIRCYAQINKDAKAVRRIG